LKAKSVRFANALLLGAKNGEKIGKTLNIALTDAVTAGT